MRVLFFSDVHADKNSIKEVVKKSEKADLLVCAGDLSRLGSGFAEMIKELSKVNKKILLIPGNNETNDFLDSGIEGYDNMINFDDDIYQDLGIKFLGIGGGGISPFNTPYELSEEEYNTKLKKYSAGITVLVSHNPPKDTILDKTTSGLHVGSFAVREWITKNQPRLCCCGHIHENAGKEIMIGKTLCFNPGPKGVIKEL